MKDLPISKEETNIILFYPIIKNKGKLSLRCYVHTWKQDNLPMQDQSAISSFILFKRGLRINLFKKIQIHSMYLLVEWGHLLE